MCDDLHVYHGRMYVFLYSKHDAAVPCDYFGPELDGDAYAHVCGPYAFFIQNYICQRANELHNSGIDLYNLYFSALLHCQINKNGN